MDWTIPNLNTRETAVAIYAGAFFLWSLTVPGVRSGLWQVLRVMSSVYIGGVLVVAAAYSAGVALLLLYSGNWSGELTKLAALWFVSFALVAVFRAGENVDRSYYRRVVLHTLGLAAVAEFVVTLHTFPLPVELVLVPLVFVLAIGRAVAANKPEDAQAYRVAGWGLTIIGVAALLFAVVYALEHADQFATTERLERFLLPFALTIVFVPFLVALRFLVVYQTMLHMTRYALRDNEPLYGFARWSIIGACRLNLGKAQLFEAEFRGRLFGAVTREDVTRVIREFREAWARGHRVHVKPWQEAEF
jgi:hypothetical protein